MKSVKRIVILLLLALLTTGTTQSAEKQTAAVSNTRAASCLVKITCDSAILPLNFETIDFLLNSSGVGGKAARQVLDVSPDQIRDFIIIEYVQELISDAKANTPGKSSSEMEIDMHEYEYAMMRDAEMGMTMNNEYMPLDTTTSTRSSRGRRRPRRIPLTRRTITATSDLSADEQTFLFSLHVELPDQVKPLAKEFMDALVENLRRILIDAYDAYGKEIQNLLEFAESRRDRAQSRLDKAMEQTKATVSTPPIGRDSVDVAVYERLEQIVDLSDLNASTSFADVIERLKTAVDPPLQIQPNWKDLLENAEVEQATPAQMDPLPNIRLRKALEILLASVSSEFAKLKYVVDDGIILIGTQDALPSKMITRVYEIPTLAYSTGAAKDLIDTIQNTIDPESWFEMSDVGEATITPYLSQQPRKLAILQSYENHQKIEKFLKSVKIDIPAGTPSEVPDEILLSEKNNLIVEKQDIEMEIARSEGRMPAIEEQIRRIKDEIDEKVRDDEVSEELRKILGMQVKRLEGFKKLVDDGDINDGVSDAEEKIARAKIELARRREQIGVSAGADQLAKFSNEMATLAIDMAEEKAMLQNISKRLNQIEQQLTASEILDPQVSQLRLTVRALEIAGRRVNELNSLALNVQPPIVSVLGAE